MTDFIQAFLQLLLEASPWLVLGLFIGGLFKTLLPTRFLHRHLTKNNTGSIIKAAALGAPLPLCSCGVIPAAMGLRRAGASKSATTSFLVSTPETGVDSVFITYALMGPFMAVVRPLAALFSALTAGTLVNLFDSEEPATNDSDATPSSLQKNTDCHQQSNPDATCCGESATDSAAVTRACHKESGGNQEAAGKEDSACAAQASQEKNNESASCCSATETPITAEAGSAPFLQKAWQGVHYAFTDLLDNIFGWLFIGIVFAAAIKAFVPDNFLTQWGSGWLAMIVMLLAGIPMYVCASASTPIATGFLLAGVSPGAVLVYLLAGPATNMATLGVINKEMGRRTLWLYLLGITVSALSAGWLVDFLVARWQIDISQQLTTSHAHMPLAIQVMSTLLLVGLALRGVWKKYTPVEKSCCAS